MRSERPFQVGMAAPPALHEQSEADLTRAWVDGPPVVSIFCATYQHVEFIGDALRGFLGQVTPFPFEVIVRDDASTDGTADIVADFAGRYPTVVRPVLETRNTYGVTSPMSVLHRLARGEFIATCEGDDYWVRPDKLARQVSLLRSDPGLSVVGHPFLVSRDGFLTVESEHLDNKTLDLRISAFDLRRGEGTGLHTSTVVFRSEGWPEALYDTATPNEDHLRNQWFGVLGDAAILGGFHGSIYRRHARGVVSGAPPGRATIGLVASRFWHSRTLADHGHPDAAEAAARHALVVLSEALSPSPVRLALRQASALLKRRVTQGGPMRLRRAINAALVIRRRLRRRA